MYQTEILIGLLVLAIAAVSIPPYLYWRRIEKLMKGE